MKRALALILLLAACREEVAQITDPVALTPETVGHVCQMNLLEHEGPKGQVHLEGLPGAPLFFSQVRDVVAYLRLPEQTHRILAVWVNDMGAPGATWESPGATNWIASAGSWKKTVVRVSGRCPFHAHGLRRLCRHNRLSARGKAGGFRQLEWPWLPPKMDHCP